MLIFQGVKEDNTDQINVESLGPASNFFMWMCHVGILHHHKLTCKELVQLRGGPLPVMNGVITLINGLPNRELELFDPTFGNNP